MNNHDEEHYDGKREMRNMPVGKQFLHPGNPVDPGNASHLLNFFKAQLPAICGPGDLDVDEPPMISLKKTATMLQKLTATSPPNLKAV